MKIICLTLITLFAVLSVSGSHVRVIGGSAASSGQFPYQISLRKNGKHFCGGSILDEKTILTAAHCVQGVNPTDLLIFVGTTHIKEGGSSHQAVRIEIHNEYNPLKVINDIAIIKLRNAIIFDEITKPIELPDSDIKDGTSCVLSGWGYVSYPEMRSPEHLQYIKLRTMNLDECRSMHKREILTSSVCTLTLFGEGACDGDSGGPLADESGKLIGLVSWGLPCARGKPDVFTKVYAYLDWIKIYRK